MNKEAKTVYALVQNDYEYDDNYYNRTEGYHIVHVFESKEDAEREAVRLTKLMCNGDAEQILAHFYDFKYTFNNITEDDFRSMTGTERLSVLKKRGCEHMFYDIVTVALQPPKAKKPSRPRKPRRDFDKEFVYDDSQTSNDGGVQ